jgi:hypothetical protein
VKDDGMATNLLMSGKLPVNAIDMPLDSMVLRAMKT